MNARNVRFWSWGDTAHFRLFADGVSRYGRQMREQQLIVTSGLPGSGKSTIAGGLAHSLQAPIFSVDPIEAAMWASGLQRENTGIAAYKVAEVMASENLQRGLTAIVDAVNPVEAARELWRELGHHHHVPISFIEVCCSDEEIHKTRIEKRVRSILGMPEVTWDDVCNRRAEFEPWTTPRLLLDSAFNTPDDLVTRAIEYVNMQ